MNTLENVKQWFIDRDLENGGRLDKQSLKLSEEFGELCAGYLKKNEQLLKNLRISVKKMYLIVST